MTIFWTLKNWEVPWVVIYLGPVACREEGKYESDITNRRAVRMLGPLIKKSFIFIACILHTALETWWFV